MNQQQTPQSYQPCEKEGQFAGGIRQIDIIEHRFREPGSGNYEIRIDFITEDYKQGKIYLDLSQDYIQVGNNSGKKNYEVSAETLSHFGVNLADANFPTQLKAMEGQKITVFGKSNQKGYLNFYLNTNKPEVSANPQEAASKIASLFGNSAPQPQQNLGQSPQPQNQNLFTQPQSGGAGNPNPFTQQN